MLRFSASYKQVAWFLIDVKRWNIFIILCRLNDQSLNPNRVSQLVPTTISDKKIVNAPHFAMDVLCFYKDVSSLKLLDIYKILTLIINFLYPIYSKNGKIIWANHISDVHIGLYQANKTCLCTKKSKYWPKTSIWLTKWPLKCILNYSHAHYWIEEFECYTF